MFTLTCCNLILNCGKYTHSRLTSLIHEYFIGSKVEKLFFWAPKEEKKGRRRVSKSNFYCDWNWYHYEMMIIKIFNSNISSDFGSLSGVFISNQTFYDFKCVCVCARGVKGWMRKVNTMPNEGLICAFTRNIFMTFHMLFWWQTC